MAPGPITAVSIGKGSQSPHAGAMVAVGHGIVEFPLMVLILFGFGGLLKFGPVQAAVSLLGGAFLLVMGVGMFRRVKAEEVSASTSFRSPLAAGMVLTVGNPYFLVWWATVGAALISRSVTFGLWGFVLFAIAHWLCDFLWYYFLSALSFRGGRFFGRAFQRAIFALCGGFLLLFGVKFLAEGAKALALS
ncbi:MAG TPA: hypothetical protein ENF44_00985 [Deltaproteobacteria bacterium]|nr:hypothetical protein [Deltaproteobacteria bacterium]